MKRNIKIGYLIGLFLYGMIVVFAYKFILVKIAIMMLMIFGGIVSGNFYASKRIKLWVYIYISYNIFIFLYSVIRGNPAPYTNINIDIVEPILYSLLVFIIPANFLVLFRKAIPYYLLMVILVGFVADLRFNLLGALDGELLFYEAELRPGFPILTLSGAGVVTFMVLYFYLLSSYILNINKHNLISFLCLLLGVPFILLTSRRALIFNFVLVFVVLWFVVSIWRPKQFKKERKNLYKYSFLLIVLVCAIVIYLVSLNLLNVDFLTFIQSAFESDEGGPRTEQSKALIEGWLENPIIGNGVGVNAKVIRSDDVVGAYELGYHAMLFSKGIIGLALFLFLVWVSIKWVFNISIKNIGLRDGICVVISLIMFLIACASNPYLGSFDFMYVLFWPLAYVNAYDRDISRLRRKKMYVKGEISAQEETTR